MKSGEKTLMAAMHLIKVGIGATRGWKSNWCKGKEMEEHLTPNLIYWQHVNIIIMYKGACLICKDGKMFPNLRQVVSRSCGTFSEKCCYM